MFSTSSSLCSQWHWRKCHTRAGVFAEPTPTASKSNDSWGTTLHATTLAAEEWNPQNSCAFRGKNNYITPQHPSNKQNSERQLRSLSNSGSCLPSCGEGQGSSTWPQSLNHPAAALGSYLNLWAETTLRRGCSPGGAPGGGQSSTQIPTPGAKWMRSSGLLPTHCLVPFFLASRNKIFLQFLQLKVNTLLLFKAVAKIIKMQLWACTYNS